MLVHEKRGIYFAIELSLREISYVLYVHAPLWTRPFARANDAKIVRSRDGQYNAKKFL